MGKNLINAQHKACTIKVSVITVGILHRICKKCLGAPTPCLTLDSLTFLINPSELKIYLCKIPTVITDFDNVNNQPKEIYTPKNYHLFKVVENRMQECCAAHIVHGCQQYCSAFFSLIAG